MKRIYNGVEVTFTNETDYLQSNVVYLITFPDGKYYVGSTTSMLSHRCSMHSSKAINSNKHFKVSLAIREFMKFDIKILDVELDQKKLKKLEEFYTIEYKSNGDENGYNECVGNIPCETTRRNSTLSRVSPVIDDFGNTFTSMYIASLFYKCSVSVISSSIKSGKTSKKLGTGFHYLNQ